MTRTINNIKTFVNIKFISGPFYSLTMTKSVAEKMGIKKGTRAIFVGAPSDALKSIDAPVLEVSQALRGDFDYIHFFAKSQADLSKKFPTFRSHLKPTGMLWISWPKAGKQGTDLSLTKIIKIGYDCGLVESKTLSIDATWSAIKFTYPKTGKIYNNSYGKLKKEE